MLRFIIILGLRQVAINQSKHILREDGHRFIAQIFGMIMDLQGSYGKLMREREQYQKAYEKTLEKYKSLRARLKELRQEIQQYKNLVAAQSDYTNELQEQLNMLQTSIEPGKGRMVSTVDGKTSVTMVEFGDKPDEIIEKLREDVKLEE